MIEPSRADHDVSFYEPLGGFGYTMKAHKEVNRTFGGVLSPLNAGLLLQGADMAPGRGHQGCGRHPLGHWPGAGAGHG